MRLSPRNVMIRETRIIIALLGIITLIALGMVLYQTKTIVLPFALACFLSFVLDPLITFFEKRKVPGAIATVLALLVTFVVLNMFGMLIFSSIRSFSAESAQYQQKLDAIFQHLLKMLDISPQIFSHEVTGAERLSLLHDIQNFSISGLILRTMGSLLNFLSNTFLVMLFLLFILMGRNQLSCKMSEAFDAEFSVKITSIVDKINREIRRYLLAKTLISLVTGLLFTIALYSFGVEFALIWGILAFLLNFIPSIGSVVATFLPLSIAFIQFDNYLTFTFLAIILILIQVVIGNIIDPRLMGKQLNLSPLVVLFSLIFWGWLWGIIGMFLAVPITVMVKIIFANIDSLRFLSVCMSKSKVLDVE